MVGGLSLAGMTETPVVIALGQRPAPATGFPTRTEQGDLNFALYTAHGEFPRIIFAPGTPEQAFYLTNKAFDLAEKYQIPAIVIFDTYLADSEWTFDGFDMAGIKYIDYRLRGDAFKNLKEYKRHAFTDTGVSPLGVPGDAKHFVVTDSDEHDEAGHIVEDAGTRIKMVQKRLLKKLPLIKQEIEPPILYGDPNPDIVIAGWGSNYGVMREAINHKGFSLVDILQPCVTFNKINTYEWYKQRAYHIAPEYNPEDRAEAFKRALEWGDKIPIGVIYKNHRPIFEERIPVIKDNPLVKQPFDKSKAADILQEFY